MRTGGRLRCYATKTRRILQIHDEGGLSLADNKATLAQELREIIQADRMACDAIDEARDIGQAIERDAEKRKAAILADAEKTRAEVEKQVRAEQEQALRDCVAEVKQRYTGKQKAIENKMAHNRARWIAEIVARITA